MCYHTKRMTKRNILSVSASFYDPVGFISPVTARVKVLFQLLCKNKFDWDDEVSEELKVYWIDFLTLLKNLDSVRLERFVFHSNAGRVELHGFSDSSSEVYCAVVFLRIVTANGVFVNFPCTKTKVAPLKSLSIPKLELLGCLLLTDLLKECQSAFRGRVEVNDVYCWSDSEIALCWITGKEKCWKPWVENRVVKIRKVVDREKWLHVSCVENPADFPTRPFELFSESWKNGPEFLLHSSIEFKSFEAENKSLLEEVNKEEKRSVVESFTLSSIVENENRKSLFNIIEIARYSFLKRLIAIVGYVYRFVNNLKSRLNKEACVTNDVLSVEECQNALTKLILQDQVEIKKSNNFERVKNSLKLFEDKEGILRLRGRFSNANLTYDSKYPALLRGESQLTELIIRDAHEETLHGVETMLSCIREKYWITKGRKTVQNVIRRCVLCKRFNARTFLPPPTPDLPSFRLNCDFAFQHTGLDFAGPLYIKEKCCKDSSLKVYILLLTCATSRALHLE